MVFRIDVKDANFDLFANFKHIGGGAHAAFRDFRYVDKAVDARIQFHKSAEVLDPRTISPLDRSSMRRASERPRSC